MEDPELHRRATPLHSQKESVSVAGGHGLIDHKVANAESAHRFEVKVRYGAGDSLVHLGRRRLAVHRAIRVTHIVPDDIIGVGSQNAGDVVTVLGCEVTVDDVRGCCLPVGSASELKRRKALTTCAACTEIPGRGRLELATALQLV